MSNFFHSFARSFGIECEAVCSCSMNAYIVDKLMKNRGPLNTYVYIGTNKCI